MSTYEPPGGQQPEVPPAYAQPQDPWAGGYEQGLASVPTDPIPFDPYAQGGEVWPQATVAHGGPYGYVPQEAPKSRTGMIVAIFLAVLLLGGGGGFAAWYITKRNAIANANPGPTVTPSLSADPTPTTTGLAAFDPYAVKVGDCLLNRGTNDDPDLEITPCTTASSFKVVKVSAGTEIPEGPGKKFDQETTSTAECTGTGFTNWYGYDADDDTKDLFFCLTKNP